MYSREDAIRPNQSSQAQLTVLEGVCQSSCGVRGVVGTNGESAHVQLISVTGLVTVLDGSALGVAWSMDRANGGVSRSGGGVTGANGSTDHPKFVIDRGVHLASTADLW
ncbi:hypothetical protein ANCCAN_16248 [Ancylostoma caninum]|uniref:Uncharacterized protein n=1 Tax=Ancylostoma caninum TaxID=29170 RepID=A0A368G036_ANCCA|nr:hypothetical protein ANCCAN_16248 [Ancylostoma caninum]